jgi:hypothetical protein
MQSGGRIKPAGAPPPARDSDSADAPQPSTRNL